jgi:hypothetical protein
MIKFVSSPSSEVRMHLLQRHRRSVDSDKGGGGKSTRVSMHVEVLHEELHVSDESFPLLDADEGHEDEIVCVDADEDEVLYAWSK